VPPILNFTPIFFNPLNNSTTTTTKMSTNSLCGGESVRVLIRLRPEEKNEKKLYGLPCAAIAGNEGTAISLSSNGDSLEPTEDYYDDQNEFKHRLLQKPRTFTYDRVFSKRASQTDVFESVSDLVNSVVHGYNATIFAYGATGSGKTFSMSGDQGKPGIVPRAIGKVFEQVEAMAKADSNTLFMVSMGFVELYNNNFQDLLAECGGGNKSTSTSNNNSLRTSRDFGNTLRNSRDFDNHPHKRGPRIELHESPTGGVHLTGSKTLRMPVRSAEQAMRLVDAGNKARATAATNLNEHSSRSHSILTIHVESQRKVHLGDEQQPGDMATTKAAPPAPSSRRAPRIVCLGKMHLVDLAGSERLGMSGAEGQRATEAVNINLSLSALGNVLSALSKYHVRLKG
jgi:hypothetical protein